MRWWKESKIKMSSHTLIVFMLLAINTLQLCDGARRAQRRKDTSDLYIPEPSAESLTAIAQAMGAAGFEDYTEGKSLVKRLIPSDSHDLDIVEHLGVIGRAGVDFPALPNIPSTGFNCKNVPTGYYADLETDCQVFHICDTSRKISFLCPNGTIFSQSHLICDWWFKVDCASAPALYESSVEYYSNEQKKSQKVSHNLKNPDLQQIGTDTNVRSESRRAPVNAPTTTERFLRHRQKLQTDSPPSEGLNGKPTARSYQALFEVNPTQRAQTITGFENRRKNLVQLISNNFGNGPTKTTLPIFDSSTHKTTIPVYDHNSLREMQVAAETASFAQNQNRQFLQEYNSKNFRPYPVYTPNHSSKSTKINNPTLTTLYDIQTKQAAQYLQEATTKRQTLVPYTKSYTSTINERREPYTRPGVSLLRDFLEKEKNKTISVTTDKIIEATARSDKFESQSNIENSPTMNTRDTFESVTKIPDSTIFDKLSKTTVDEEYLTSNLNQPTTEEAYQERRDRLMRKLNFETLETLEPTLGTTKKYFENQSNKSVQQSLTPKTLQSLAIYYATALDNLSTTPPPEDSETTTSVNNEYGSVDQSLPDLFSPQTISKYGSLFGHGNNNDDLLEDIKLDPNGTYNELAEDLTAQMSQGPLATSPQIRELAQVFTHALSAYLQDPVQFRKVLSDIRPTHPSFSDVLTTTEASFNTEPTTTVNEDDQEILGFSDDHKIRDSQNSIRGSKALNINNDYPTTIQEASTTIRPVTEIVSTSFTTPTTPQSPYRCCGRISASYTTASTNRDIYSTLFPFTNTGSFKSNTLGTNAHSEVTYTTDNNFPFRQGNKYSSFGKFSNPSDVTPFNEISEITTVPTAWGLDVIESTLSPITNSHQKFESKKIRPTNTFLSTTPVYFTETDSIELENEEELQRAHSQSFVSPQSNSLRHGKQIKYDENKLIQSPSEDLEAPTQSTVDTIDTTTAQTTTQVTTTIREQTEILTTASPLIGNIFTSPDSEKSTNDFQWQTTFGNWQSTVLDPITLNDGLSPTGPEQGVSEIAQQTNTWALDTATTQSSYLTTNEPVVSSTVNVEITTNDKQNERSGKLLRDPTSTEPALDISTVTDTIVEKAKEIMGGMNATTTQKLMNVMKKTKSKTVKRLILLLVQTCDDDHNSTAEASKKALLEALMAVSQKDMEDIAQEESLPEAPATASGVEVLKTTEYQRRSDRTPILRRGKNLNIEAEAINALSNTPTTTESPETEETTQYEVTTTVRTTPSLRGGRKYVAKTTETEQFRTTVPDRPIAEARIAPQGELKVQSDTRALELLRSLYTIAARWG